MVRRFTEQPEEGAKTMITGGIYSSTVLGGKLNVFGYTN
jgi:hypothetical protein